MKGRDQGRIHGLKGVGVEIFWLVTENSLSRYQKRGFCNPNLEGVERYFRPNFQKWEGDDRPPPDPSRPPTPMEVTSNDTYVSFLWRIDDM